MATPFHLTAAARTISLRDVYKNGDDAAWTMFKQMRWPENDGKPICPKCGCLEAFEIKTRLAIISFRSRRERSRPAAR